MNRKKLYRRRSLEEVSKRFSNVLDNSDDSAKASDPALQTFDVIVDSSGLTARKSAELVKTYSRKLRDRPLSETRKHSESLFGRGTVPSETEKSVSNANKIQRQRIMRDYAKKVRKTAKKTEKNGKKVVKKTESAFSHVVKEVASLVVRNPFGLIIATLLVIVLLAVVCTLNSCGAMFGGVSGGTLSATYTATDDDIYGAEEDYKAKEAEFQDKVNRAESLYPGYDEYRYEVDDVSHDPWCLTSALTVLHEDYTREQVQGTISGMVETQYSFETSEETETRYRTEERTGYELVEEKDEKGKVIDSYYQPYTYYVEVPYEYRILTVKLENHGIEEAVDSLGFDDDTTERYEYMNETKGERAYLF
ncbi:MAG: hypothetical protein K6E95_02340 [Lachnospiraceae bacterium]|nr:hypothetical protein [Lachnospiraceae bacterium]